MIATLMGDLDVYTAREVLSVLSGIDLSGGDLVVDLEGVEFVDSAGLKVIHTMAGRLREQGRALIVLCPSGHLSRILRITGVLEQIAVVSDLDEAGPGSGLGHRPGGLRSGFTPTVVPGMNIRPADVGNASGLPGGGPGLNPAIAARDLRVGLDR